MRRSRLETPTKTVLTVTMVWIPNYRKRTPTGSVAIFAGAILRQITLEHERGIITGKCRSTMCARSLRTSLNGRSEEDDALAQAHQLSGSTPRVPALAVAVLGQALLGRELLGGELR